MLQNAASPMKCPLRGVKWGLRRTIYRPMGGIQVPPSGMICTEGAFCSAPFFRAGKGVIHKTIPIFSTFCPPPFCCFPLRSLPFRFVFLFSSVLLGTVVTVVTAVTVVTVVTADPLRFPESCAMLNNRESILSPRGRHPGGRHRASEGIGWEEAPPSGTYRRRFLYEDEAVPERLTLMKQRSMVMNQLRLIPRLSLILVSSVMSPIKLM